jgi:hypothetical protein
MPFSTNWLIENEIILMQYQGTITVDELIKSLTTIKGMIDASPRNLVHIITDVGAITQGIPVAESIKIIRSMGTHPRSGWNITLREKSMMVRMGIALGRSLLKVRARTFDTLDEALRHLKQFDDQLTWSNLNDKLVASLPPQLRLHQPAESNT